MTAESAGTSPARLPQDPVEFVQAAERLTNSYDLEGALALYADDAVVEVIANGAREEVKGRDAIRGSLEQFSGALKDGRFWCRKVLLSASGDLIVNDWTGGFGERGGARGMETWRFDEQGKVVEHRLMTFFSVQPASSLRAALDVGVSAPGIAVQLAKAQLAGALARRRG